MCASFPNETHIRVIARSRIDRTKNKKKRRRTRRTAAHKKREKIASARFLAPLGPLARKPPNMRIRSRLRPVIYLRDVWCSCGYIRSILAMLPCFSTQNVPFRFVKPYKFAQTTAHTTLRAYIIRSGTSNRRDSTRSSQTDRRSTDQDDRPIKTTTTPQTHTHILGRAI